jgi:hypothetical protein
LVVMKMSSNIIAISEFQILHLVFTESNSLHAWKCVATGVKWKQSPGIAIGSCKNTKNVQYN